MAVEFAVVKNQVHEIVGGANANILLAVFETEARAEFEQKFLQMIEEGGFEIMFSKNLFGPEAEEFEYVGIFD